MKVLVTGGAGFIGSHCVDHLLARDHSVLVVDDFSSGQERNLEAARQLAQVRGLSLEVKKSSLSDPQLWKTLPRCDAVFHLAAQTSVTASVQNPSLDFSSNVAPVMAMMDWIRRQRPRCLVYANTAGALYGEPLSYPTDERDQILPRSPYGTTKAFFEMYLSSLCHALKSGGEWSSDVKSPDYFTWASLRLGNVYGPRQTTQGESGVVPIFFQEMVQGRTPSIFGDGKKTRDYVHVSDVARAFDLALEKMSTACLDNFFNVGTGLETTDLDVFEIIQQALRDLGSDAALGSKVSKVALVKNPNFADVRPGEARRSVLNCGKIDAFLGWLPQVKFEQGVTETVHSYAELL